MWAALSTVNDLAHLLYVNKSVVFSLSQKETDRERLRVTGASQSSQGRWDKEQEFIF